MKITNNDADIQKKKIKRYQKMIVIIKLIRKIKKSYNGKVGVLGPATPQIGCRRETWISRICHHTRKEV